MPGAGRPGLFRYGGDGAVTSWWPAASRSRPGEQLVAGLLHGDPRRAEGGPTVTWLRPPFSWPPRSGVNNRAAGASSSGRTCSLRRRCGTTSPSICNGTEGAGPGRERPQIGERLRLITSVQNGKWTVKTLAAAVAISRSAFAGAVQATGRRDASWILTRWRMLRRLTCCARAGRPSAHHYDRSLRVRERLRQRRSARMGCLRRVPPQRRDRSRGVAGGVGGVGPGRPRPNVSTIPPPGACRARPSGPVVEMSWNGVPGARRR